MKRQWRDVLEAWKRLTTSPSQSLSKDAFLGLLNRLHQKLKTEIGRNANLIPGFRATGLHPFNPSKVLLNKLPPGKNEAGTGTADTNSAAVSDAVLDVLSTMKGEERVNQHLRNVAQGTVSFRERAFL
ncbi:pogo transposable element with krab domain [Plakobranchus ocellatus]|uniref:Pogo transposable element with krab domain n=1 Tax=Plakobranchus ocellatus TaxID=259542 RepID=A0AAV4D8E8_9GAST|nr:pogo transposable element with krab domain [Plakobranchus ocellatus]